MHPKEKILELYNRNKIYEIISNHPGVNQRQIIKKTNLPRGTVKYHLDFLTKKGHANKNDILGHTRFYPSEKIGRMEKEILALLHQKIPRHILIFLICSFGASQGQISKEFRKDAKTINYHLKKLLKMEFIEPAVFKEGLMLTNIYETKAVERKPIGKEKIYRLKHPYLVYYFLVKYKESFFDDEITKNILDYIAFIGKGVQPKKYEGADKQEDRLVKLFSEIFPFPLCA